MVFYLCFLRKKTHRQAILSATIERLEYSLCRCASVSGLGFWQSHDLEDDVYPL